jgi:SAM-dependent methyltransferase
VGFSDWNRRITQRLEGWYLQGLNMESAYKQAIRDHTKTDSLILDAGAGKRCFYKSDGMRIVGADILSADLTQNPDIEYAVATDLSSSFPFRPGSFDAITACYFMEHIPDTEKFVRDAANVLKPSGKIFLLFPCRYAPFAVFNRIVPNRWTVGLLHRFLKDSHGGFPAKYSKCWPNGMRKVLERNGFRIIYQKVCHYQAFYCAAFLPLYMLCLAYDAMTRAAGIETLASSVLIGAEKIGPGPAGPEFGRSEVNQAAYAN